MLSDWETQFGGAAICASRLAESLCTLGHKVTRVVACLDGKNHPWVSLELQPSLWGWAVHRLFPGTVWEIYSRWEIRRRLRRILAAIRPDVINIHNLHGAVNASSWPFEMVPDCASVAPVVWTLHDMWSFTGRCAYNNNCPKYLTGCDASCPTPKEYPALVPHKIADAWKGRQMIFQRYPSLVAVAPSHWLTQSAQQGFWSEHPVKTIPYGLPLGVYRPVDRILACQALEIPSDGFVLMVAAFNLSDPRKGGEQFLQALRLMKTRPLTIITLGGGSPAVEIGGVQVYPLGYVDHERTKVLAYSAADVFVHPSLADNLPNTVMESIACGTPVASFRVGGTPDMVRPGQTGWLTVDITSSALAASLDQACGEIASGYDLRRECRKVAEAEYGDELQAQRYIDLFNSITVKI